MSVVTVTMLGVNDSAVDGWVREGSTVIHRDGIECDSRYQGVVWMDSIYRSDAVMSVLCERYLCSCGASVLALAEKRKGDTIEGGPYGPATADVLALLAEAKQLSLSGAIKVLAEWFALMEPGNRGVELWTRAQAIARDSDRGEAMTLAIDSAESTILDWCGSIDTDAFADAVMADYELSLGVACVELGDALSAALMVAVIGDITNDTELARLSEPWEGGVIASRPVSAARLR